MVRGGNEGGAERLLRVATEGSGGASGAWNELQLPVRAAGVVAFGRCEQEEGVGAGGRVILRSPNRSARGAHARGHAQGRGVVEPRRWQPFAGRESNGDCTSR